MEVTPETVRRSIEVMPDEELLRRWRDDAVTEMARPLLMEELVRRGIELNSWGGDHRKPAMERRFEFSGSRALEDLGWLRRRLIAPLHAVWSGLRGLPWSNPIVLAALVLGLSLVVAARSHRYELGPQALVLDRATGTLCHQDDCAEFGEKFKAP